jgi:hypothetical protein
MPQQEMVPKSSMQAYVPPTMLPEHARDPGINKLLVKAQEHEESTKKIMGDLLQQGQQHLAEQQQRAQAFRESGPRQ